MPHFITSAQEKDHITSANDALWNAGTISQGQFALGVGDKFACSMPDTNTLRIMNGQASCDGYRWSIDDVYEEYTVENGTPGYKRIVKAVADITLAPKEDIKILVLNGEEVADNAGDPVEPEHIAGNLNEGDTHVQMPICTVLIDGINPQPPVMQMNVLMSASEFQAQQKEAWDSIN